MLPTTQGNGTVPHRVRGTPGVRNLLGKRILEDIREAWERDGAASLKILAKEDPGKFAQLGVANSPEGYFGLGC